MRATLTFLLSSLLWQAAGSKLQDASLPPVPDEAVAKEAGFSVESAAAPLLLPRDERLVYRAKLDFGLLTAPVGTVTQECRVEPYRQSILLAQPGAESAELEAATVTIHAQGDYSWYSMDSTIESRILPQAWPRLTYRQISEGTEKRRREIMLGLREGSFSSSYRKDTSKGAPKGTRIWREPVYREVPEGTVDLLTAVFYARTLVRDDLEELNFPMIDKENVWQMKVRRGKEERIETKAGTFDVVEALLEPAVFPGEDIEQKKVERFEGLFGIHGSIRLWVEKHSGVPVRIEGDLPVGPFTLGLDVVLESYSGTPPEFVAVEKNP